MTEDVPERNRVIAFLRRWRSQLVVGPLVAGLVVVAVIGARMVWADPHDSRATPVPVVCWDGVERVPADCGRPVGAAGLRWVFPEFRPNSPRCHRLKQPNESSGRPSQWSCSLSFHGKPVVVVYSQSPTLARGLSYFRTRYADVEEERSANGERAVWRVDEPNSRGRVQATSSYLRFPYAVTVTAGSVKLRDSALDTLVAFRAAADISIRPDR